MQGRKKRIYETLQEPELSMMMDFIYKDVWCRMKKLNNTAAGDCAHVILNHGGIINKEECHFQFQDTLALIKECLAPIVVHIILESFITRCKVCKTKC